MDKMKTYIFNFSITITATALNEELAEFDAWKKLENLLVVAPSVKDFSCHSYGAITELQNKGERND